MKISEESGMTLIEVMAVLVISMMVLTLAYNLLFTMIETVEKSSVHTKMRNEAAVIINQLDIVIWNVDEVLLEEGEKPGKFRKFTGIDRKLDKFSGEAFLYMDEQYSFEITGQDLLVDGIPVNDSTWDLSGSSFEKRDNKLYINLHINPRGGSESNNYSTTKIYQLRNE